MSFTVRAPKELTGYPQKIQNLFQGCAFDIITEIFLNNRKPSRIQLEEFLGEDGLYAEVGLGKKSVSVVAHQKGKEGHVIFTLYSLGNSIKGAWRVCRSQGVGNSIWNDLEIDDQNHYKLHGELPDETCSSFDIGCMKERQRSVLKNILSGKHEQLHVGDARVCPSCRGED